VIEYEDLIADGDPAFAWQMPGDEWDAISLNYTSGTTGDPKGVVLKARAAMYAIEGMVKLVTPNENERLFSVSGLLTSSSFPG